VIESHPTIEELVDYAHGELSAPDDAAVHAHLAECSSCADAHAEEVALTQLLRAHAGAEEREMPVAVAAGVREAIARRPAFGWERLQAALRPALVLPVAAALAVALYFGFNTWRGTGRSTPIDAAYYVDSHAAMAANASFGQEAPAPLTLTSDTTPDETH